MDDAPEPGTAAPASAAVGPVDLAPLADLVAVMDRLRSPGGCAWDAEQTHATLLQYAVEEVHEVVEAVEAGDRAGMREELGDLLLQVVFHARVAQEHPDDPFDLAEVAAGVAAKLRRRHPHVFGGGTGSDAGDAEGEGDGFDALDGATVHRRWERIKQAEKQRASAVDGIPVTLPALARARKVLDRAHRAGLDDVVDAAAAGATTPGPGPAAPDDAHDLGDRLLALVAGAGPGVDPEAALRAAVRRLEERVRTQERARRNVDPGNEA